MRYQEERLWPEKGLPVHAEVLAGDVTVWIHRVTAEA